MMAEFCEVMKQTARMCASYRNDCAGCGLANDASECPFEALPEGWTVKLDRLAEIEHIVMDWAEKHPEPRYPTWNEWQEANFPNANAKVSPCAFSDSRSFGCMNHGCDACRDFPIPADIAEKLGIKPIGGTADA